MIINMEMYFCKEIILVKNMNIIFTTCNEITL